MLNKHFSANSNAKPTKAFYNYNNGRKNAYENIQQQQEQQRQEDNNSKSKKKEIKKHNNKVVYILHLTANKLVEKLLVPATHHTNNHRKGKEL